MQPCPLAAKPDHATRLRPHHIQYYLGPWPNSHHLMSFILYIDIIWDLVGVTKRKAKWQNLIIQAASRSREKPARGPSWAIQCQNRTKLICAQVLKWLLSLCLHTRRSMHMIALILGKVWSLPIWWPAPSRKFLELRLLADLELNWVSLLQIHLLVV